MLILTRSCKGLSGVDEEMIEGKSLCFWRLVVFLGGGGTYRARSAPPEFRMSQKFNVEKVEDPCGRRGRGAEGQRGRGAK